MDDALTIPLYTGDRPDVTVVVVSYNTANLLDRMFAALEAARGTLQLQVIVVDNASRDNSVEVLRARYPNIELILNTTNVGFGRANNQALPRARGRYLLLLNTDAIVSPDTLQKTVDFMDAHLECGVLGVKLVGYDGALQPSCRYFPTPWNLFLNSTGLNRFFRGARLVDDMAWDHASVRECDWVPGCYYMVRPEVIERAGLFDPRFYLYYEEVDHCLAVRQAGWRVVYYPFTHVVHVGGESAAFNGPLSGGRQILKYRIESELLYFRKHYGVSGVLTAALLAMLADGIIACKILVRRFDIAQVAAVFRHTSSVLRLLTLTGFGAQSTQ